MISGHRRVRLVGYALSLVLWLTWAIAGMAQTDTVTVSVSSSGSPSMYGDLVSFTATVTPTSATETPSGTVQFRIDGVDLGSPVTLDGSGSAGSPAISSLGVATHSVEAIYSGDTQFIGNQGSVSQDVQAAPLTITASNQPKNYGQTLTFNGSEFTSSGLKNGETIGSVTLTSAGTAPGANVAGSPYTITPSLATGGTFNANNYSITYQTGNLTVNTAPLTITADNKGKNYGQVITFTGSEFTSSGLQNGETIGSVTLNSAGTAGGRMCLARLTRLHRRWLREGRSTRTITRSTIRRET